MLKNRVQLFGNVGNDVEFIKHPNGVKIAKFSLAVNETYKNDKGVKVENTDWFNLTCFGPVADIANNYVKKGMQIAIEGKLKVNSYEDKQGAKRFVTDIIVSEILLLSKEPKEPKEATE